MGAEHWLPSRRWAYRSRQSLKTGFGGLSSCPGKGQRWELIRVVEQTADWGVLTKQRESKIKAMACIPLRPSVLKAWRQDPKASIRWAKNLQPLKTRSCRQAWIQCPWKMGGCTLQGQGLPCTHSLERDRRERPAGPACQLGTAGMKPGQDRKWQQPPRILPSPPTFSKYLNPEGFPSIQVAERRPIQW